MQFNGTVGKVADHTPPCCDMPHSLPCRHSNLPYSNTVEVAGRRYTQTRYFLRAEECPDNYHSVVAASHKQPAGGRGGPAAQEAEGTGDGSAAGDGAPAGLLPIGVTTYTQLFSDAELAAIELAAGAEGGVGSCGHGLQHLVLAYLMRAWRATAAVCGTRSSSLICSAPLPPDELDAQSHEGRLPEACFHRTVARGGGVKRTKFFFGARCGQCTC